MSPFLFNVYVHDLSAKLNKSNVSCSFAGMLINHLMYADDLVLLVPSVAGLDKLLRIYEKMELLMMLNITHSRVQS